MPTVHAAPPSLSVRNAAGVLRAASLPAAVTVLLILTAFVISTALNWPGHLSYDSVVQLNEGRRGVYANWHPPVMSWLLGLADGLLRGAGLFVAFDAVLLFAALAVMAWRAQSWAAPFLAALFLAAPQFSLYPDIAWKDVLFAGATLAGFAALLLAARHWPARRWRGLLLAKAGALFVLAALARQNGMIVLVFAALSLGLIAAGRARERRAGWLYGGAALLVLFAVTFLGQRLLDLRVHTDPPAGPAAQIRLLQTYDVIGALAAEPGLPLARLDEDDPGLARLMRTDGVRLYTPERNDTLARSPALIERMWDAPEGAIAGQWLWLLRTHPRLYLATRWAAFDWVFLTPKLRRCVPFDVGIDGPAAAMRALHLKPRFDDRDQAMTNYESLYIGTPLLSHGFWAALALAALLLLLRRRRSEDFAVAGLLAAMLAFAASFFVISIACDYRYLYALDVAAMGATLYVAGEWKSFLFAHRRQPGAGWRGGAAGVSEPPASP